MKLGTLIEQYDELNSKKEFNSIDDLQGINNEKYFQGCQSNKNDIELERYRICRKGMFAYNKATSRNGEKISIAYRDSSDCLVSPSYICFKIKDEHVLMHEYLMLLFRRPIFDRYVRFHSWGSATEFFDYDDMSNVDIDLPSLTEQKRIVSQFDSIEKRIMFLSKENDFLLKVVDRIYNDFQTKNDLIEAKISDLGSFSRGKNITQEEMIDGEYDVVSAGLEPSGKHNNWNVKGPSICISASGVNAGYVSLHFDNVWAADCSYCNECKHLIYLYKTLEYAKEKIDVLKDGHTGQPHVYANDVNELEINMLFADSLEKFDAIVNPFFDGIDRNNQEIKILKKILKNLTNNLN